VEDHLVLGQVATDTKSNEITAIPELLKLLDVQGAVLTMDALNCQKEIARQIIQDGGDYLLVVKDNHPTLHAQIQSLLDEAHLEQFASVQHDAHRQVSAEQGRKEIRRTCCSEELTQWVSQRSEWAGLRTLVKVQYVREQYVRETLSETKTENRYLISSLPGDDAQRIAELIRRHWSVENSLHWCLDMGFDEDHSRVGRDHGAENLAVLRRIALNLLKQDKSCKLGIKNKRLKAARNRDYLLKVMSQQSGAK
jgi:predicted transposase YbfD/YdcC